MQLQKLSLPDLPDTFLCHFIRYQEVRRCWRKTGDTWALQDISYTDDWDDDEKQAVLGALRLCIAQGGAVFAAYEGDRLIGFASLNASLFGSECQYVNLDKLHVTREKRGQGIGKALFDACREAAKAFGAKKLYISAHSAEEPMAFYRRMGCVFAQEINRAMAESEPSDCQLECNLYPPTDRDVASGSHAIP